MFEFKLPDPGEGIAEADIVHWLVAEGDQVKVNDIVVEIETAKSLVELPAPVSGTVAALLVAEGDTVEVGTALLTIDDGSSDASDGREGNLVGYGPAEQGGRRRRQRHSAGRGGADRDIHDAVNANYAQAAPGRRPDDVAPEKPVVAEPHGDPLPDPGRAPRTTDIVLAHSAAEIKAKPPVRHLAKQLGVDLAEVTGTGPEGLITAGDVEAAAAMHILAQGRVMSDSEAEAIGQFGRGSGPGFAGGPFGAPAGEPFDPSMSAPFGTPPGAPGSSSTTDDEEASRWFRTSGSGGEHREPIRGVRKVTAQAMIDSRNTHVHVTEWVEVDVTATMEMVDALKARREFAGLRVSPLLLHAKAVCLAMAANPVVNASWDDPAQEIVYHHDINLGVAAATPRGLMVPNIKGAQNMTLLELCRAVNQLVQVSREGRLQPSDFSGGTFTITNVGVFGVDSGTPVINRDESAILVMGAIARKPWVVGQGASERIEPRWVTTLALGFDHRLIDGEQGSQFLHDVASILNDPGQALLF